LREKNSDAFAYTNLETVAQAYVAYLDRRSPGTYAAFSDAPAGVAASTKVTKLTKAARLMGGIVLVFR
jgi:hypothetical protein